MTRDEIIELFAVKFENEAYKFERIENPSTNRRDLHAFNLLDKILGDKEGYEIISAAEHDIIYLDCSLETLAERATEEQILELVRCGVQPDEYLEALSMFK